MLLYSTNIANNIMIPLKITLDVIKYIQMTHELAFEFYVKSCKSFFVLCTILFAKLITQCVKLTGCWGDTILIVRE